MSTHYLQQPAPEHHTARDASRTTLLDNEEVLAVATTYPPGGSVPLHTHRFPSIVCVLEGGMLETTSSEGAVETYDMRPGSTMWSPAAHAHSARNIGPTPIRIVEIEVKHAAGAASAWHAAQHIVASDGLEWMSDTVDPRRAAARLVGDPTRPGPYTIRYRAAAGYEMGLHMHPDDDEQLTVLSGAIRWSTGAAASGAPEYTLGAGGFVMAPAGTPHRILALEDTVLQMSGVGPRTYIYLDGAQNLSTGATMAPEP